MKLNILLVLVFYFTSLVGFSASPVYDLVVSEIPFVGERTTESISKSAKSSIRIVYGKIENLLNINIHGHPIIYLKLNRDIQVYSICWENETPWFVLRKLVGSHGGSVPVAIAKLDDSKPSGNLVYFNPFVDSKILLGSGRVFDLKEVKDHTILATFSFHNSETRKITYVKGLLKFSELIKLEDQTAFSIQAQ